MLWLTIALAVFILQIATVLILEFRRPANMVAWLLILYVLPVIGFVMYYFLAKEYSNRKKLRKSGIAPKETQLAAIRRCRLVHRASDMHAPGFAEQERLFRLLQQMSGSPVTGCNRTEILTDGEATFQSILSAIAEAKHHIHMEYYTLRHDEIGQKFKQALVKKASEGVEVRLVYDGVGSYELHQDYVRELEEAGVRVKCFLPPRIAFFDKRINYRNHRKIVVVDGIVGYVGGINIGDEYLGRNKRLGFWRDTHLKVEGDSVYFLQSVFMQDWEFTAKERLTNPAYLPEHPCIGDEQVQIVSSGPDSGAEEILECIFSAIAVAKERIYIATPYFIPDGSLLMALRTAALSGVDVRIILPEVADSRLVLAASLSYAAELLPNGVRVYRYMKGFIHAKVVLVDRLVASVGTANMDLRSFYSNFELNALLFDERPIARLERDFERDLRHSRELKLAELQNRPRRKKAAQAIARMLSPLL